jgi:COP9 signalosome complex subunit 1
LQADAVTAAKLKAAAGLAYLDNRRYKLAARAFVEVSPELGTSYSDVSDAMFHDSHCRCLSVS